MEMQSIDSYIQTVVGAPEFFATLAAALLTAIYVYMFTFFIRRRRMEHQEKKHRFFQAIRQGLNKHAVNNINDLVNIYRGVNNHTDEEMQYRSGMNHWLREFLVEILAPKGKADVSGPTMVEWKELVTDFIAKNEEISPYADLPQVERNILNDISDSLRRRDTSTVSRKMKELAAAIQARADDLNRLKRSNRWSVGLAIAGLILTVTFGLSAVVF
ncbi:hypothetical protein GF377_03875 [candidate division GN15 bacterium]|nr:hypothetical protein [candidate division GN15 bacterium]